MDLKRELAILRAVDNLEDVTKLSDEQLNSMLREYTLRAYPIEVRNSCTYPECKNECAFKDRMQLCLIRTYTT